MLGPRASVITGSAVDTSDSYFRGTLVVDFDGTVTSDTPMYDAETGARTTSMAIDSPPSRFDFEVGYDALGRLVYDQVALDPAGDPTTSLTDEVRRVRLRNGRFEVLTAPGHPVSDEIQPSLQSVFGTASRFRSGPKPDRLSHREAPREPGAAPIRPRSCARAS